MRPVYLGESLLPFRTLDAEMGLIPYDGGRRCCKGPMTGSNATQAPRAGGRRPRPCGIGTRDVETTCRYSIVSTITGAFASSFR